MPSFSYISQWKVNFTIFTVQAVLKVNKNNIKVSQTVKLSSQTVKLYNRANFRNHEILSASEKVINLILQDWTMMIPFRKICGENSHYCTAVIMKTNSVHLRA